MFFKMVGGLTLKHQGPQGEQLTRHVWPLWALPLWGRFFLRHFSQKFHLSPSLFATPPEETAIRVMMKKKNFSIDVPARCSIQISDHQKLWEGRLEGPERTSLSWSFIPDRLEILFPNSEKILVQKEFHPLSLLLAPIAILGFCGLALVFHVILGALTSKISAYEMKEQRNAIVDLSKMNFSVISLPASSQGQELKDNSFEKLLSDWNNIGTPLKNIHEVLKPSWVEKKWAKVGLKKMTWDLQIHETIPLNISHSELDTAFRPLHHDLKECYDDALIYDSSLRGELALLVGISKMGTVDQIHFTNEKIKKASQQFLLTCFKKAYQKVYFPRTPNQDFSVTYTLFLNY